MDCMTLYHNVATLGPAPRIALQGGCADEAVIQVMTYYITFLNAKFMFCIMLQSEPADLYFGGFPTQPGALSLMEAVRVQAAEAIGCLNSETALFASSTRALNAIAEGV